VTLQASVAPGYGLADPSQALVQAAQELNMPAGYSTLVTGRGRELERTFTNRLAPLQREGSLKDVPYCSGGL